MARETLGEQGGRFVAAAYLALSYSLMVAYVSKAGELVSSALDPLFAVGVWQSSLLLSPLLLPATASASTAASATASTAPLPSPSPPARAPPSSPRRWA